jgi:VWFA-related protein
MARSRLNPTVAGLLFAALLGVGSDAQQKPTAAAPSAAPAPAAGTPDAPAAPQDPAAQSPVFRTGINFVRVDVIVSDKSGRPVADLKQGDFQISEDNKPQKIDSFRLVTLDGGATPSPDGPPSVIRTDDDEQLEASRDDTRLFAIFLDDYHVRRGASVSVRTPIAQFIQTQLGPSDMLGVMYPLEPVSSIRMTRNHDVVVRGLDSFVGRKGDYTPRNEMEQQYANYPAETVEQIRNQISLSALKGLITHMGSLKEGRKSLILVSEGYSDVLPPQLRDPVASLPGADNPDATNPDAGDAPGDSTRTFFADSSMQLNLREVWDLANKNNVAIYAVDPRGLPTSEFDISQPPINQQTDRQFLNMTQDTLRVLADQTDGRAIVNRNDLANGMKQIVRDSSAYYLLGYTSSDVPPDGKFHEIKVQVKRPGVQVRARKGYWALTTEDVAKALAPKPEPIKGVETALASISAPAASHNIIRTWVGTSRGSNGRTRVTFVWEPVRKVDGDRDPRAVSSPARVMLTAVGPDGAPYFRGRVPDAASSASSSTASGAASGATTKGGAANAATSSGATAGAAPSPSRVTFDANPGALQMHLSVEGSASQVLDTETREITVPDLTAAQPVLGTPEFFHARTARELQQIKANPDPIPAAAREFSRTDRLLIRVPVYGPGGTAPPLSVHLLNRAGQPMSELPATPAAAGDTQEIDLPLAGLAAGEYILEVKSGDDARQLVGFRVTS